MTSAVNLEKAICKEENDGKQNDFAGAAWLSTAEMICKHFAKGKEIVVEGKLSSREYEDNSGNKRTVVELTADRVHFSGSKDSAPQKPAQTFEEISEDDGDFPF